MARAVVEVSMSNLLANGPFLVPPGRVDGGCGKEQKGDNDDSRQADSSNEIGFHVRCVALEIRPKTEGYAQIECDGLGLADEGNSRIERAVEMIPKANPRAHARRWPDRKSNPVPATDRSTSR